MKAIKILLMFVIMIFIIQGVQGALTDGLVAYWKADTNGAFPDSLGVRNATGTAVYTTSGKINNAYNYTSGLNMTFSTTGSLPTYTFNVWAYLLNQPSTGAYKQLASNSANYIGYFNSAGTYKFVSYNGALQELNSYTLNLNSWYMITFIQTGTNVSTYINGTYVGSGIYNFSGGFTRIGNDYYASNDAWNGTLDEIGIWNRTLNSTELTNLYNSGVGLSYPFLNTTNFSITATNNFNSSSINTFNATLTSGATQYNYSTTSGTITTGILTNSTSLWNITIQAQNQFDNVTLNKNVSTSYVARLDQYPVVFQKNRWNSSNLTSANITVDGVNYSTSSTLIYVPYNTSKNVTSATPNYLPIMQEFNLSPNTVSQFNVSQSVINVTVRELFTNATISNFSINLTGYGVVINTSGSYGVIYPNNGSYTATVIDNSGADTFHTTSATFNVSFLDNKTVTIFVHEHFINVFARDIQTNATINTYTINLTDLNLSSDQRQNATTSGIATFPVIHHSYNLTIVSAPGYAFTSEDGTFNQTQTVSISSNTNVTFYLYKYNSVNFTFYDVDFPNTLLLANITMGLFYDATDSINYTTSVGWIFAENLTAGDWEARYSAPLFNPSNYFFTITESSTQRITLYLQNDSKTTLFKVILRDQNDDVVPNNILRLQQQFALLEGQYITIRECKTNAEGICYMYIQEGIDTSYRFIVIDIDGNMIKTTDPAPIVTLASEDKVITIRVDTGSNLVEPLQKALGIDAEITFSGNVSTYDFIDGYNAITGGCFKVSRRAFVNSTYTTLNYTCISGTSGSISYNFTSSLQNDSFLLFQGYVNYTDNQILVAEQSKSNRIAGTSYDEDNNLFFILVLFCFLSFAMVFVPNIFIQILVDFGALIGVVWIGYTAIGIPIIMSFLALGLFIAWDRKTARGFN